MIFLSFTSFSKNYCIKVDDSHFAKNREQIPPHPGGYMSPLLSKVEASVPTGDSHR